MREKSVITRTIEAAGGVHAPGHLGELTQTVDFELVDAVLEETGTREKRLRLLPSRVVVYFVLALALFENCSCRAVWGKLTVGLAGLPLLHPAVSSLSRARRRIGLAPLRRLFEILAGPVAHRGQAGAFWRGLRTVAVDGTLLRIPDEAQITWRFAKRASDHLEFGYPLLRLVVLVECGTRAVLAAAFGPESDGELTYAQRLLNALITRCSCWAMPDSTRTPSPGTSTPPAPSSWCVPPPAVSPPLSGILPTALTWPGSATVPCPPC